MKFDLKRNDHDGSIEFRGRVEAQEVAAADLALLLPDVSFGEPTYRILSWLSLVYMHGYYTAADAALPEQQPIALPHEGDTR